MDGEHWIARPGPTDRSLNDRSFPFTRYVHRDGMIEALEFADGTVLYAIPGERETFVTEAAARSAKEKLRS